MWGCGNNDPSGIDANPLAPDTSYAVQGKATVPIGTPEGRIGKSVLQADGKLLVAGWRQAPASEPGRAPSELFVIRLHGDGLPDTGFGTGGELRLTAKGSDTVADMAVQTDGRILLAVDASEPCVVTGLFLCTTADGRAATRASALLRVNADGTPDAGFGINGRLDAPASSNRLALGLQTDGRILLLRSTGSGRARVFGWALDRYRANGTPDPTFNQGDAVASSCQSDEATLLLQPDGAILIGGVQGVWYADPTVNPGLCMVRLNSDGSRDTGFASPTSWTAFNTNVSLQSLSLLPGKGFVTLGRSCDSRSCGIWVNEFDPEGRLAPAFGLGGTVQLMLDPTFGLAGALVSQKGELTFLGTYRATAATEPVPTYQPTWVRLDATGRPVAGFGLNGVLVQAPDTPQAQQLLQDGLGRWLVVSQARMANDGLAVVVSRLRGNSQ